jgi:uncharacterized membrane protein
MPLCVGMLLVGLIVGAPIMVLYFVGIGVVAGAGTAASEGEQGAAAIAIGAGIGVFVAIMLVVHLVAPIFTARLLRMFLTAVRGGTPTVGDIFKGETRYGSMVALTFLQSTCIFLGYLLLIVPGVILAIGLYFSVYFVVDRRMGAVEAMKASWAATKGRKGQVFVLMLLLGLVSAGCGMIPFVGNFIGYSLMFLGISIAFLRLMGEPVPVLPAPPPPAYPAQWQQQPWGQQQQAGPQQPPAGFRPPYGGGYGPPPGGGYGPPPGGTS